MKILLLTCLCLSGFHLVALDSLEDLNANVVSSPNVTIENIFPKKSEDYLGKIIPVLTLLIGFILGKTYEYLINLRKINFQGKVWLETFIQLKDHIEIQIENIDTFLRLNPIENARFTDPNFVLSLDCNDFDSLDSNSLIPYIRKKYRIDYSKTISLAGRMKNTVRMVKSTSASFNKSFDTLKTNSNPHHLIFAENLQLFRKLNAEFIEHVQISKNPTSGEKKFANDIVNLSREYSVVSGKITSEKLYLISDEFFPKYLNSYYENTKNSIIDQALTHLTKCDQAIKDLQLEREYLRIIQEKIRASYKRSAESIDQVLQELK